MSITLNANALVTLDLAKLYCKVPSLTTDKDDIFTFFINSASEFLETECGRNFKSANYTEVHSGRKQNTILLQNFPVTAFSEVMVDGSGLFTDPTRVVPAASFAITDDQNTITYLNNVFPNGYANVRIKYTAGFAVIPSDLQEAALWIVFWKDRMRDNQDIGRPQRSKGDEQFQILQEAPKDVKNTINRYKTTECPNSDSLVWNE